MKKKLFKIVPKYAIIPLISMVILNFLVYNGSNFLVGSHYHYNLAIKLDSMVPFVPAFISIYLLAFLLWIIGYIVIARENEEICYHYTSAEMIAKIICFIIFLILPTTMVRPEITGNGIWSLICKFVYLIDEPVTLFPSIHCLESWMCFRGSLPLRKVGKTYKIIMFISAVLVFLSTILVKQHVIVDIFGGILVVEIGLLIAKKFKTGTIFKKIIKKAIKKV